MPEYQSKHPLPNVMPIRSSHQISMENRINGCHYRKSPFLVVLSHKRHELDITLKALPSPVTSSRVTAAWLDTEDLPSHFENFRLVKIVLPFSRKSYEIQPLEHRITTSGIEFVLPDRIMETSNRKQNRYICHADDTHVSLTQNSIVFPCQIVNFSARGILVEQEDHSCWETGLFNAEGSAILNVVRAGMTTFSGQVCVQRRSGRQYYLNFDLKTQPMLPSRHYRARRSHLNPSPLLVFNHPITGKMHHINIVKVSSLGLDVEETLATSVLVPGLVLSDAVIQLGTTRLFTCLARVVYSVPKENELCTIVSGLNFLDGSANDHFALMGLIQQSHDPRTFVGGNLNIDDLFDFFFESGFVYPQKYTEIIEQKAMYERTFSTIYQKGVEVERHFTYQVDGVIQGHISALRLYRNSWINHHHAALNDFQAGLKALRAISEYQNDSYRLNLTRIKYILAYYRPENKFPARFFGQFAEKLNNKESVSQDHFGYYYNALDFLCDRALPPSLSLVQATSYDIAEFISFYRSMSGGIMPDALDLTPENFRSTEIEDAFNKCGLKRRRDVFALKNNGALIALIDVQTGDHGLNLSEITNATTIYQMSSKPLPVEIYRIVISYFAKKYGKHSDPVMIFPKKACAEIELKPDKTYVLWILDITKGSDPYMKFLYRYCRSESNGVNSKG